MLEPSEFIATSAVEAFQNWLVAARPTSDVALSQADEARARGQITRDEYLATQNEARSAGSTRPRRTRGVIRLKLAVEAAAEVLEPAHAEPHVRDLLEADARNARPRSGVTREGCGRLHALEIRVRI